jgi:hypothetical protein
MRSPYVLPSFLLADRLQEILDLDEPFGIRNQPEFVRPAAEHVQSKFYQLPYRFACLHEPVSSFT